MLGECEHSADSWKFVEFLLTTIYGALSEIEDIEQVGEQVTEQVEKLLNVIDASNVATGTMTTADCLSAGEWTGIVKFVISFDSVTGE